MVDFHSVSRQSQILQKACILFPSSAASFGSFLGFLCHFLHDICHERRLCSVFRTTLFTSGSHPTALCASRYCLTGLDENFPPGYLLHGKSYFQTVKIPYFDLSLRALVPFIPPDLFLRSIFHVNIVFVTSMEGRVVRRTAMSPNLMQESPLPHISVCLPLPLFSPCVAVEGTQRANE